MREISAYRFLRSNQISSLVAGSHQQILRRLQALYHHGYLERPRAQIDSYHRSGSQPYVYGLADRGAAYLRREFDTPFDRMDWTGKNRPIGRIFLDHALMISEVMVTLRLACRERPDISLIDAHELLLSPNAKFRDPLKWSVQIRGHKNTSVIPDRVFALDSGSNNNPLLFFLEADRGTMPVVRRELDQTSLYRKLLAYSETWKQEIHTKQFGFRRFRVLTVVPTPERVDHIVTACEDLPHGKGLFLFVDIDTFRTSGDAFSLLWTNGYGDSESLIE